MINQPNQFIFLQQNNINVVKYSTWLIYSLLFLLIPGYQQSTIYNIILNKDGLIIIQLTNPCQKIIIIIQYSLTNKRPCSRYSNSTASPSLSLPTFQQTNLLWAIPSDNYQSNTISIVIQGYAQTYLTNITFKSIFATSPYVILSLSSLQSIIYDSQIYQQAVTRTTLIFTHKLILNNPKKNIKLLRISYTALSLAKFYYLKPHSMTISLKYLSISNNPNTQYTQVNYIFPLQADRKYVIGIVLTGFKIQCNTTQLMLAIDAQLYKLSSYLVKVTINNGYAMQIQYTRLLIDKTAQAGQPSGLGVLYMYIGVITHSENYTIVQPKQTRLQGIALAGQFYGIKQFMTSFNCITNNSVFITPKRLVNMKTTIIIFIQHQCPSSHLYVYAVKLCYNMYHPRMYKIGLKQAGFCFQACYTCIGPNYTNCKSYLPIEANKTADHIACLSNYSTNAITGRCRSCISYVQNCNSCTSDGQCLTCLLGCNLINVTYCDCSNICPYLNQIISPRDGKCICKPQYYRLPNNTCAPCGQKCYLCSDNPVNCMACSDPYQLAYSSCVNFIQSTYFQNSNPGTSLNEQRCTQYIGSGTCVFWCPLTSYILKKLCYQFDCPYGTFPFVDIHDNKKICQICPDPCIDCDNYFICKKCRDGQFLLDQSGVCRGCSTGCGNCTSPTTCLTCKPGYQIIFQTNQQNQTFSKCKQILPSPLLSCPAGCRQCAVQQYCQVCAVGFYRFGNNMECEPCTGQGALLNTYALVQDIVQLQCTEICGDGYLYINQCDDGNVDDGDGCDSKCQIQDGYRCEYLIGIRQSICDKIGADKRMTCKYSKNLTQNSLNISIHWRFNSSLKFNTTCQNKMEPNFINSYHTNQTFTFNYNQTIQNITCKFQILQSIYFTQIISCNITSQPYSLYYPESIILNIAQSVFSYINNPIFYIFLVIRVVGIEPYEILINYSTIILYLASLYQFQSQPSSLYGIFAGLKIFAFDWDNMQNDQKLDRDGFGFVRPCYLMLIFLAIVIAFQQIIVRCLSKYFHVFKQIFLKRFILYLIIYTSMEPILTIYISSIFVQGLIPDMKLPIIIAFLHIILMIFTSVLLCCLNEKIIEPKGGQKIYLLIIVIKVFSAISPLFIVYFSDDLSVLIVIIGIGMIILTPYTIFNKQMEIEDYYYQTSNWLMQQQDKIESHKNLGRAKIIVRRANFIVQFGVLSIIFVLRFLFMASHQFHADNNYVNIGAIITILFVICSLLIGCLLNIISQIITLIIYYKVSKQQEINDNMFNSRQDNSKQNIQQQYIQQQQKGYQYVT